MNAVDDDRSWETLQGDRFQCSGKVWQTTVSSNDEQMFTTTLNTFDFSSRSSKASLVENETYTALALNPLDGYLYAVTEPSTGQKPQVARLSNEGKIIASATLSGATPGWRYVGGTMSKTGEFYLSSVTEKDASMYVVADLDGIIGFGGTLVFKEQWEIKGLVEGSDIRDIAVSPIDDLIYAFDNKNSRVAVIDPTQRYLSRSTA